MRSGPNNSALSFRFINFIFYIVNTRERKIPTDKDLQKIHEVRKTAKMKWRLQRGDRKDATLEKVRPGGVKVLVEAVMGVSGGFADARSVERYFSETNAPADTKLIRDSKIYHTIPPHVDAPELALKKHIVFY